ncbi:hypothetical protein BJY52DRAFT_1132448 [Lactarius psammicola]|nr:hypothetical protein BJY52DRAFT_1132448 [Lactarius psammicola]
MLWYHNGSLTKSLNDLNVLVQNVIRAPDFEVQHFDNFDATKAVEKLFEQGDTSEMPLNDGWYETSVPIILACDRVAHRSEGNAPTLNVAGLYYRKPLEVIKAALQELNAQQFHIAPFKEYWVPRPNGPSERIYSELYNSDAYIQEHDIICTQSHNDPLEAVIISMMLWSDSTHLTSFGNASLWPIYIFFGNQSKYDRAKPTTFSAHHLAYIPELDDSVQDEYITIFGKAATKETLTHLRRELIQSIWAHILDDEFMDAYVHGTPFDFKDGIKRQIYPRIFTYSADYPEKVLLACIKFLGKHPCPRCLVKKEQIAELGTKMDTKRRKQLARIDNNHRKQLVERARRKIYVKGVPVNSKIVSDILEEGSLTPTQNTFSQLLGPHGVDFHSLFVVDLLHEFELGVWRATFTHIIRILYAQGNGAIQELNRQYNFDTIISQPYLFVL